jgi:hypothetical protein
MTLGFSKIDLEETSNGKIVTLVFKDKLEKEDYELFVPQLEGLMDEGSKIRLLVKLKDFRGWSPRALWEDTKFSIKHFRDIERLAIVGNKKWEKGMTVFTKPFTSAKVHYFDESDMEAARKWIRE